MSEISDIRPTCPIVPVKRRDKESANQERLPRKPKKRPPTSAGDGDDSPSPLIDEYV